MHLREDLFWPVEVVDAHDVEDRVERAVGERQLGLVVQVARDPLGEPRVLRELVGVHPDADDAAERERGRQVADPARAQVEHVAAGCERAGVVLRHRRDRAVVDVRHKSRRLVELDVGRRVHPCEVELAVRPARAERRGVEAAEEFDAERGGGEEGEHCEIRVNSSAARVAASVVGADTGQVLRAAQLAKADLVSEMVCEFPEVQGVMGQYYARNDGEDDAVATAIAEHYSPAGPSDACPTGPVSVAVALADKIDTLVGFWAIEEKPTGSKDPFALRRAALGVIRLIMENGVRVNLMTVFRQAHEVLRSDMHQSDAAVQETFTFGQDLLSFFADRLKVHLREQGVRHDLITAIFALGGEDDLVRLLARVEALRSFLETTDGANLLTAYKRAANILRIEEKKDGRRYDHADGLDDKHLKENAESRLYQKLMEVGPVVTNTLEKEQFSDAMGVLASMRLLVDAFFDNVTVNADDPALRENRLKLLSLIRSSMNQIADFSQIEGGEH